jgi:hypothetical protein
MHGARTAALVGGGLIVLAALIGAAPVAATGSYLGGFSSIHPIASTVPANGDVNPYGVAVVPRSIDRLTRGDVLVSNFNAKSNEQGTGTTIVEISPGGTRTVFAHVTDANVTGRCPGGVGLTTALIALQSGWVIVGSLPTRDGTAATASAGCLIVLDAAGRVRETFAGGGINGPWDMTAWDGGAVAEVFVTNVLNGTLAAKGKVVDRGTVVRLVIQTEGVAVPRLLLSTVIGSGFPERTDPAALVIGPTGVGLSANGTLYVADTLRSRIAAIPDATFRLTSDGTGSTITTHGFLDQPLGLTIAPNGDVLTVNAANGDIAETTPGGSQIDHRTLDGTMGGGGLLFGLAIVPSAGGVYWVDDGTNALDILD